MLLLDTYLNLYTSPNQSQQIMYFLKKYTNKTDIITDATAGIGGNSISFCKYYSFSFIIDQNEKCIEYLNHNLNNYDNKLIINDNCLDILKIINTDVIFFDPPWGGSNYKTLESVNLNLNDIPIHIIIDSFYKYCKVIALKAPVNYSIKHSEFWNIEQHNIYKNNDNVNFKLIIYYK